MNRLELKGPSTLLAKMLLLSLYCKSVRFPPEAIISLLVAKRAHCLVAPQYT